MALNAKDKLAWLVDDDGHAGLAACSAAALGRRRERAEEGEEVDQRRGNNTGSFWAFSWRGDEAQGALEPSRRRGVLPGRHRAASASGRKTTKRGGWAGPAGGFSWARMARGVFYFFFSFSFCNFVVPR